VVWVGVPGAALACVVAGVADARVVAVAEPAVPAEPAELMPVAEALVAGAGAAVPPQPQAAVFQHDAVAVGIRVRLAG